ncbi:MAG TPA: penicillin-binding transpeptidase domain-containing protein, partial [Paludibacter sp.]
STGSILKPFLFTAMLDDSKMMPNALMPDLPLYFSGYAPQNFDLQFRGAVPASEALMRSLNVPAVFMLKNYTPARFLDILKRIGLTTFNKDADHYGLSLILGGGEATLEELVSAYGSMARVLNRFNSNGDYNSADYKLIDYLPSGEKKDLPDGKFVFRVASIWQTLNILTELNRPEEESGWQQLSSSGRLAWKTGTSFGFRDAWAIGVNPKYVIGVWVGNANGEGRPGLTGGMAAAPILFELSSLLNSDHWFEKPMSGMLPVAVCRESGYRASVNCNETDTVMVPAACLNTAACPYHVKIHLDANRQYLVNAACYPQGQIVNENWFILPPAMEYYYRKNHPGYRALPVWLPGARQSNEIQMVELIYPDDRLMVYLPKGNQGEKGVVIFQAAHRRAGATLFWHLDEAFLGTTKDIHQMAASPSPGNHKLLIVDELGNSSTRNFKVVE